MKKLSLGLITVLLSLALLLATRQPLSASASSNEAELEQMLRSFRWLAGESGSPSGQPDEVEHIPSPDGQWTAIVNRTKGSLILQSQAQTHEIFPENSTVGQVIWSPDSSRLLIVRTNWLPPQPGQPVQAIGPIEIWQLRPQNGQAGAPALIFQAETEETGPQQIVFGRWSPDSRHIVFWVGMLSASILADGLPPLVLDTGTGAIIPVATASPVGDSNDPSDTSNQIWSLQNVALVNPGYHSWSPASSKLAITAGGYRSAQVNKWLNLVDIASGRVTTVISQTEQIPGMVVWSPQGNLIAYAAVPAGQTGPEWADLMTFENPAIAGRRIYLLEPSTGQYRRLNDAETYQDAPVWSSDGTQLYYVQRDGDDLQLMIADPETGRAEPVPDARQPIESNDPYQPEAGYYGQFGRDELLAEIPDTPAGATATDQGISGSTKKRPATAKPGCATRRR